MAQWTERTSSGSRNWSSIASSSNGAKLAAAVDGGYVYTSTDSGVTWTERTASASRGWESIASSGDGERLAVVEAGVEEDPIRLSTDSGVSWYDDGYSAYWVGVAYSSDGRTVTVASVNDSPVDDNVFVFESEFNNQPTTAQLDGGGAPHDRLIKRWDKASRGSKWWLHIHLD